MPWLLIKFQTPPQHAALLTDVLEAQGALSVTIESATEEQRLQSGLEETSLWNQNRIVGLFDEATDVDGVLDEVRKAIGTGLSAPEVTSLADADWERVWMADYRPIQVAPQLWICPSWHEPPDPEAVNLFLDPGLAFGTGTHPTTALCLAWLADQSLSGRTIIDYGCGSGILAIAALLLGADSAIGVDIDPLALQVSQENAARNGVEAKYRAHTAAELNQSASADIVVANILAGTLIELARPIGDYVKPKGSLALSGILSEQVHEVDAHYRDRFDLHARNRDGWALLTGRKLN